MKLIVRSVMTASVLALGAVAAQAADLTYEPAPVIETPAAFNWTGFYVGVHGGLAAGDFKYPFGLGNSGGSINGELEQDASGGFGGAQIGYNWQFNPNWVIGAEADIAASSYEGKVSGTISSGGSSASAEAGSEVDWFGTVRARLGYAHDNLLVYGTGGLAYGKVKSSISGDINGSGFGESTSETSTGWTVGGGVEYGITQNVSLKAEYLYVDLGSQTLLDVRDRGNSLKIESDTKFHTLKAGLNYKF
jgi:outer membrane immunogenic protein